MRTVNGHRVLLQAHRGVSTEYPENTLAAFRAACGQGYDLIELDPKFTRDGACVVLHDRTVNRTGRTASGGELTEPRAIAEMTLGEARSLEYGSWKGARFAGEPLPLLGEVFSLARERHMPLKLDNVIGIVDRNRLMIDGCTEDVMALEPFADKWRAFGWDVLEVDGHDFDALDGALEKAWAAKGKPVLILANTIKGKGVDFMENNVVYHYASGDSALCERAKASILKG